jgi:tetratricopeptide (TPR) repeat protein
VYHYDWRWADAEKEFRRAIELNPNYSLVRIWYANLLMSRRRMPQALEEAFAARELDPFSQIINTNVGWVLDFAGRHEDAVRQLRRVIDMDSSYVQAHWRLTDALMHLGRFGEAIDEGKRLVALSGGSAPALGLLAAVYANAHEPDRARAIVAALLARSRQQYVPAWSFASPLVALGEKDAAATWLEKGFAERSNGVAYLLADPDLAALHGHPRYEAIVARVGLK